MQRSREIRKCIKIEKYKCILGSHLTNFNLAWGLQEGICDIIWSAMRFRLDRPLKLFQRGKSFSIWWLRMRMFKEWENDSVSCTIEFSSRSDWSFNQIAPFQILTTPEIVARDHWKPQSKSAVLERPIALCPHEAIWFLDWRSNFQLALVTVKDIITAVFKLTSLMHVSSYWW